MFSFLIGLTACSSTPEVKTKTVVIKPPNSYLTPTPHPDPPEVNKNNKNTFSDLEEFLVEYNKSLKSCNLDKKQIKEFLEEAE